MKKQSILSDDANGPGIASRVKSGYGLRQVLSLCADEAAAAGFPLAGLLAGAAVEAIDDELNGLGMETPSSSRVVN